ncbi:tol-pal system-associated acyl-CoA thioesterase [Burkholderia stagnalis]|uniref:4-hydroxybenzoyl-CoA thioesterase n=1 Tax=Burkholderia stagnalis TaxID=1503054 RepID=A0A119DVQ9_9BURK|nr:tol-pal system-associated acyl-CoA thioesterase [Burkholderia stagnalis]AOK51939.1 4-hydroxybenzoyl-CoA thioesterase [Burkholderia stagnalis]KAB0636240.1 tol-pal system-associated acyl-CoA thioesterase [Burkholderia stagnalis]KVC66524.1 4-hydroxybenzoyl-CoA thioesterase [Burkholderia stagnalis]KVL88366.1 4-hydroxybenzoyl-CoA thioesterase [Burkholderia stagnalis]KVL99421.1 4-hydroxybenzoyl-CoA thioesterase [Burkholderia stagnalis]
MRAMTQPTRPPEAPSGFAWPVRVYYEDTDAGGIVFYANYLKFFERARTEWLRACGIDQRRLADETGAIFIVRSTALDYRAPARLDDTLAITSRPGRIGRASVEFMQEAWRGETLLVSGHIRIGCVDRDGIRPAPIPPGVLDALQRGPVTEAGQTVVSTGPA